MPFGAFVRLRGAIQSLLFSSDQVINLIADAFDENVVAAEDATAWIDNPADEGNHSSSGRTFRFLLVGARVVGAVMSGRGVLLPSGPGRGLFFNPLGGGSTYISYDVNDPAINIAVNGDDRKWKIYRNVLLINVPAGLNGGQYFDGSFANGMDFSITGAGNIAGVRITGGGSRRIHVNATGVSFNSVTTPIAPPSIGATLANGASGGTVGVIAPNGGGTVWATDSAAVFGNVNQLAIAVNALQAQLKAIGLVIT